MRCRAEAFGGLAGAVLLERTDGALGQLEHAPALAGLCVARGSHRPVHGYGARIEVHLGPGERAGVLGADASEQGDNHVSREPVLAAWSGLVQDADRLEIGQRHATYYLALAEHAGPALTGPQAAAWLARLDTEHDNLRAALRWARDADDGATVPRLAAALWPFWQQRGHLSEGRRWLKEALDRSAGAPVAASVRINGLIGAAQLAMNQAAYDQAAQYCAQAVALARDQENPPGLVAALNIRGMLAREQDRYADAARDHQEALTLARAGANRRGEAAALLGLAYAAMFTGDASQASALAGQSLATVRARLTPAAYDAAHARPARQTPQQIITAATSNRNPPPTSAR